MANLRVFLSHNSVDNSIVLQIADGLRARKLNAWIDDKELYAGQIWQDVLEEAIRTTQAGVVCYGAHGFGRWEKTEIRALNQRMVKEKLPVIPVLLPGTPETYDLGIYLEEATFVDLRNGLTEEGLDCLYRGITQPYEPHRSLPVGPVLHNLPSPSLHDLFKGRKDDLQRLEVALEEPGWTESNTQSEAISGLDGIGKTRLAVEHAWRCGDRYTAAFFVRADSPQALHSGLASLAGPALLNLLGRTTPAEEEVVAAVLRWLREHPGWLLTLDSVDGEDAAGAVGAILPSLSEGRVLITSRRGVWPPEVHVECLATIPREEAIRFLLQRTEKGRDPAGDDDEQAGRLAELLGDLPLALEQAAAYIAYTRMLFAEYLRAWESEHSRMLTWHNPGLKKYSDSVVVTWQTTFQQLGPTAAALLRLTAFLAPDPLPVAMFEKGSKIVEEAAALLCEETGRQPAPCPAREALSELVAYSMATYQSKGRFTVHRIVQEVLRDQIPADRRGAWLEKALRIVNDFATGNPGDVRTWRVWNLLRPHAARIVVQADGAGIAEPTSQLMNKLGKFLKAKSLYAEAEPLMRRALAIDEKSFGPEHPRVAKDLIKLALLLKDTNRPAEAEPLMRRALAIDEQLALEHPTIARDLNTLALLLKDTNRPVEAEPLMRRALAIDEKSSGTEHPRVATDLNTLALLLKDTNRPAEAELLMRRALAIDERPSGTEDPPQVAIDLNNLALLLKDTNRPAEAEPLMRRALAIDEKSFGTDHPVVATDLNTLALLLMDTNRLDEAEPLMRRALALDEQAFGPEHPQVAIDLNTLVLLLKAANRLAEAEPLMCRALAIDEQAFGPDHPQVATDLNTLARLLKTAKNRQAEAERLMRRALAIDEQALGTKHPNVARDLNTLARLLTATNRVAEAEPLLRRALAIDEQAFGTEHPNVARDLNPLARLFEVTNRLAEAEPLLQRALAIDEHSFGTEHPSVATDLINLALFFQDTDRLSEAEPLLRRAVGIRKRSLPPGHPKTEKARRHLEALLEQAEEGACSMRSGRMAAQKATKDAGVTP